jgi:hypothetical protein
VHLLGITASVLTWLVVASLYHVLYYIVLCSFCDSDKLLERFRDAALLLDQVQQRLGYILLHHDAAFIWYTALLFASATALHRSH